MAHIYIDRDIYFVDDIIKDIRNAKGDLTIHLTSYGGSVIEGLRIYNAINERKDKTYIIIDGIAASIASVIAMAGDIVKMYKNSFIMIHKPFSLAFGNKQDISNQADILSKIEKSLSDIYKSKMGKNIDMMESYFDNWLDAEKCKVLGLIDVIIPNNGSKDNIEDMKNIVNVSNELKNKLLYKEKGKFNNQIKPINMEIENKIKAIEKKIEDLTKENKVDYEGKFKAIEKKIEDLTKENKKEVDGMLKEIKEINHKTSLVALAENENQKENSEANKDWDWYQKNDINALEKMQKNDEKKYNELLNNHLNK